MKFQHLFLITVVLLIFSLHGVAQAQEAQERPIVKLIYFIPSDWAPQPDFDAKMDTLIKDVQALFANQMEAHGFDRKTFLFETDTRGKAVVHHFVGQFTEEYYKNLSDTWDIFGEIEKRFNAPNDIYLVAIDGLELIQSSWHGAVCGLGAVNGGRALVSAAGPCFNVDIVAHELVHVFGLNHGLYSNIDNKPIFSYTWDPILVSFWAADWWDVHPAFNPPRPAATNEYQRPTVEMLAPSLAAGPNVIRLRFKITDPNESLHQAQLMASRGDPVYLAGQRLNGKPSEIVEFATTLLLSIDQTVYLRMIDADGNITQSQQFPIDITPLLPLSETLSTVPLNKGRASQVAYSPDGQRLAVAGGLGVWLHYTKIGDPPVLIKKETPAGIRSISISPDGQTLAIGNSGRVRLLDVRTTEPGLTLELPTIPLDVSFSSDGRLLAIAGSNGTIYLWDVMTGELRHTIEHAHLGNCDSVAFSPDGQTLASGGRDGTVHLWDVSTGALRQTLTEHAEPVKSVAFSPDGKTLASAGHEKDVRLWDVMTGELRQTITTDANSVWSVAFSPDGKTLASGSPVGTVSLWDVSTAERRHILHGHTTLVNSISFSPDSKSLASVSHQDSIVNIWDVMTGERRQELTGYTGSVESMSFSPDSETLATVGEGKSFIDMWDVSTGVLRQTLGHTRRIRSISFSPDGKTLASAADDNFVLLWDVSTGALRQTLTTGAAPLTTTAAWAWVNTVSFSPDGKTLASADTSKGQSTSNIRLWDVMTGKLRYTLTTTAAWRTKVSFSPDGKTLAGVHHDNTIGLWDVMTGELRYTLTTTAFPSTEMPFSPDGKTLAGVNNDNTIGLWDVMTGEHRHTLTGHADYVAKISFSPDGKTLASASNDTTIGLWDVMTGERRHTLRGYISWVWSVAFSPDGKTLVSGGSDYSGANNTLHLWDTESGEFRQRLTTDTHSVQKVLFSPDGQTLAITGIDGTIRLWKVTPIPSEPEKIKEDINADGIVNIQDLVAVAAALGQTGENAADVNGDGEVNIQDLVAVAAALGQDAAAPSALRQQATGQLTAADVQQWIELAQQLDLTAPRIQRGLLFLQYLLAALTPQETILLANYPNPFNPETWIPYQLAKPADVTLTIYDIQGRVVRDLDLGHQRAGIYQGKSRAAYWDGRNAVGESVASGVYFYTLTAGDFTATRKMLIRK